MFDQRRLEILRAFARHQTMTAAAESLFMSTSAVSQQLAILEREAGVELIARAGRRVTLTEAGAALTWHADRIAAVSEAAAVSMRRFGSTLQGTVRLSAFPSFCATVVPAVVADLRARFPELSLEISDLEPRQSLNALRDGSVDLAVIDDLNPWDSTGVDTELLATDELLLCMPAARAGVEGSTVRIADLQSARWVLDGSQSVFDSYLHQLCERYGFVPDIVARCSNVTVTLALVEAFDGVALVSGMQTRHSRFDVAARTIEPRCERGVILARRTSSRHSAQLDAVATALRTHTELLLKKN
ncbi:LysR family transcriptional regulator [Agromyces aerolatus]|uniref:LysR family transcriptional regulator n=1 Tax=Agromyces sp. LY-1074 TaxID=3074080 RepID=UPI002857DA73|nr:MULTISPECIES: LysR family transcriptional regulator [unclassified Agromyces]MDR5699283.1 LysR family transcriptional regulator [Agromyces sp. LY-1074]MDR5705579.1 LysR family transcriptional regulator [Agromyces sp. LY-1358]